ncbi:Peptidyl-prolyl cis-trans isomerase-like-like protein [Emericellopsis cladophorae]|uniref:Peptidyl-prolyl cis-trans isomerase-like 2 n=1 Tax=Emericellopsis cladophorae TaxID=2686198 RepID=A0A9P9XXP3_9HYPO|nr:Peptidyl-prolyl cis-trans isomerase-like-like protein [Emericellopsis cladophorae]KAI6779528.1 Peptidyl-prolyl cis-trans isomerase-like-like protein [Emericellopsis cladophorae]
MGKGTDKLYITHSEWSSSDAFSASVGSNVRSSTNAPFRRLPFNFCAASLQPFKNPVCTPAGTIFDVEVISSWLDKHPHQNPVDGSELHRKDLIRLEFARNAGSDSLGAGLSDGKGDLVDPVTFKVFTDNTHIVAIRHGSYANVFAWDTVERMNIKPKMWQDLVDDQPFTRADIITLQDPQNAASRNLDDFKYLKEGLDAQRTSEQEEERQAGDINAAALGSMGDKVSKAKAAVDKARRARETGGDVNRSSHSAALARQGGAAAVARKPMIQDRKLAANSAAYTTGKAAASFTSTGLTPETSGERALLSEEDYMLKPKRVLIKGYARMATNLGDMTIELHPEYAPKAVWNFVRLAQRGYYRNIPFHRNIPKFMIQGGDPTGTGKGGQSVWGKYFSDEFEGPMTHAARGTLSMANKGKNTNSSQFFITYKATPHLDRKHTVFGTVIEGLDTLTKLEATPVDGGNRPTRDITIKDIVVYVDPFEEFQKQKSKKEAEEEEMERLRREGGTEDDKTTWTGKRIRGDGTMDSGPAVGVGKYLDVRRSNGQDTAADADEEENNTWDEVQPAKKKVRTGGFGNFDNW